MELTFADQEYQFPAVSSNYMLDYFVFVAIVMCMCVFYLFDI